MEKRRTVLRFGPDRRIGLAAAGGAVLAAVYAAVDSDREGRLLAVILTVVLVGIAIADLAFNPRLIADGDGLEVRGPTGRLTARWAEVQTLRLDERSRWGLMSRALEFEVGERLIVLGRHSLGRDPREVYDLLSALDPSRGEGSRPQRDDDDQQSE